MQKINSTLFPFSFFLSGKKQVSSLKYGAIKYGGATQDNKGKVYSNIEGDSFIRIHKDNNRLSLFVPSTTDTNKQTDNADMIKHCTRQLKRQYNNDSIIYYSTKGSWYSDDLRQVIIEDITIITVTLQTITETDINYFITLANHIKKEMNQEGVSITINNSLAIV
jgi:hypothetical protein